jgi:hypothetical protein
LPKRQQEKGGCGAVLVCGHPVPDVQTQVVFERIFVMCKQRHLWCSFVLAALLPVTADADVPIVAELPAPKIGNVWRYRTLDLWNNTELSQYEDELVEIQADRLVFRVRSSKSAEPKTRYEGRSLAACRRMRDSEAEMCDGALAFPLRVGNKNRYEKRPWKNGNGHSSAECDVKGIESVTVPAGTFDAFRVECDGNWHRVFDIGARGGNSGRYQETFWYSPSVGGYVKWHFTTYHSSGRVNNKEQTELIEFVAK